MVISYSFTFPPTEGLLLWQQRTLHADDPKSDLNGRFLTLSLSPGFQLFPTSLTSYSDNMQQFAKDDECDIIVRLQSKSGGCPVSLNNCQVRKYENANLE